jgi:hypothetical protein
MDVAQDSTSAARPQDAQRGPGTELLGASA